MISTTADAAERLGVSPRRVRALCAAGRLGTRRGGRWHITPDDIDAFTKTGPLKRGPKPRGIINNGNMPNMQNAMADTTGRTTRTGRLPALRRSRAI